MGVSPTQLRMDFRISRYLIIDFFVYPSFLRCFDRVEIWTASTQGELVSSRQPEDHGDSRTWEFEFDDPGRRSPEKEMAGFGGPRDWKEAFVAVFGP